MKSTSDKKPGLLMFVPMPPPQAGPEISSEILVHSPLKDHFDLIVIPSNVHPTNAGKGNITLPSVMRLLAALFKVTAVLAVKRPRYVYTILNQNFSGFVRDSIIVLIGKAFGKKAVLHFRGSTFHLFYTRQNFFFKAYIRFILRLTDAIILQAQWIKERFAGLVPEAKLKVIPNAVPAEAFIERGERAKGLNGNGVTVLYLNHISVAKGFKVLLDAMREIVAERDDIRFLIAGDRIDREKNIFHDEAGRAIVFEDLSADFGKILKDPQTRERIQFIGEVSDKKSKEELFRAADLFVLASYSEGFPLSVLEAMAAGLPLVVTPVGALKEILQDGVNALFVEPGKADDLREKILRLADEASRRKEMGERNQSLVRSRFTVDHVADEMASALKGL
jgi:glycosyltransferase involved in cell wall biosynthesis